ncbi:hypothetical protein FHX08_004752 [Rhizobium sp. BK529]|uniref:hypothetical protein n=1 Tax=Rhizobium sp. BK529 TaxID=2586983 RepID=UPI0016191CF5|nr:hypothetical protein [Rhizobium sp. BK529]MBB3594348.1 hypothetical protein [Rhizobium sp. BK529]
MMLLADSTVSPSYIIDILNESPGFDVVAEEQPPTHRSGTQSLSGYGYVAFFPQGQLLPGTVADRFLPPPTGRIERLTDRSGEIKSAATQAFDPWLQDVFAAIASYRDTDFWQQHFTSPPTDAALNVAEILSAAFTKAPMTLRPQFVVDGEGQPSFTMYNDEIYLHLTIEAGGLISWYREAGENEDFGDDVDIKAYGAHALVDRVIARHV